MFLVGDHVRIGVFAFMGMCRLCVSFSFIFVNGFEASLYVRIYPIWFVHLRADISVLAKETFVSKQIIRLLDMRLHYDVGKKTNHPRWNINH